MTQLGASAESSSFDGTRRLRNCRSSAPAGLCTGHLHRGFRIASALSKYKRHFAISGIQVLFIQVLFVDTPPVRCDTEDDYSMAASSRTGRRERIHSGYELPVTKSQSALHGHLESPLQHADEPNTTRPRRKRKTFEEKCAWLKARQSQLIPSQEVSPAPTPVESFPAEMLERKLSLQEVARLYQWEYTRVYRFWKDDPRTLVAYKPNPAKAPKMSYQVPYSAVMEVWESMTNHNHRRKAA